MASGNVPIDFSFMDTTFSDPKPSLFIERFILAAAVVILFSGMFF